MSTNETRSLEQQFPENVIVKGVIMRSPFRNMTFSGPCTWGEFADTIRHNGEGFGGKQLYETICGYLVSFLWHIGPGHVVAALPCREDIKDAFATYMKTGRFFLEIPRIRHQSDGKKFVGAFVITKHGDYRSWEVSSHE